MTSYQGAGSQVEYLSLEDARKNKLKIDWANHPFISPGRLGIQIFEDYPLGEIREYISWIFFFLVWQLRGKWPDILNDPKQGKEASKLYDDALKMLDWIVENGILKASGILGFFPANAVGDDIEVYS